MKYFVIFGGEKVVFFLISSFFRVLKKYEHLDHLINVEILSPVVERVAYFSAEKPLDYHDTTFAVSNSVFKV